MEPLLRQWIAEDVITCGDFYPFSFSAATLSLIQLRATQFAHACREAGLVLKAAKCQLLCNCHAADGTVHLDGVALSTHTSQTVFLGR
eukprot:408711-Amphidinium_carterae.1